MSDGWPLVTIGDILQLQRRWIKLEPHQLYTEIGVRSFGKGIFHKNPVTGLSLGSKKVLRICPGDLVFNNVFAWEGAVGVASEAEAGSIGSHRFITYTIKGNQAGSHFLRLFFRTEAGLTVLRTVSPGSAGRNKTLNLDQFARQRIPLPPLHEQQRIVATIEALAAKSDEARADHRNVIEDCETLCRSVLFCDPASRAVPTPMSELVSLRKPDVAVVADGTYHFAGVYCFGRGIFVGERKTGLDFAYKCLTRLRAGDFVYPKLMAWEGALGIVPPDCDGLCVSPEYPVFSVNTERVLPEVLDVYFRSPSAWPQLAEISTGTNMRRRRLHPSSFLAFKMPLPPMETQMKLREVKTRLDSLADVQLQSAAELDALLPSILDRAFKGER